MKEEVCVVAAVGHCSEMLEVNARGCWRSMLGDASNQLIHERRSLYSARSINSGHASPALKADQTFMVDAKIRWFELPHLKGEVLVWHECSDQQQSKTNNKLLGFVIYPHF